MKKINNIGNTDFTLYIYIRVFIIYIFYGDVSCNNFKIGFADNTRISVSNMLADLLSINTLKEI